MVDAWSAIIDWITKVTWGGAGIGASILVAVVVVSGLVWDVVAGRLRRRKQDKLSEFVSEGQELLHRRDDGTPPHHEAIDWTTRIEEYLQKKLETRHVLAFRSSAGLPPIETTARKGAHRRLERYIQIRLARLEEILKE